MGCFENVIAFKGGCGNVQPTSGLWTDQIGLHKSEIESYLQKPYQNADAFFLDQLNMAIEEVKTDVYNKFAPTYKAKSIITKSKLGITEDNMTIKSGQTGLLGGYELSVCYNDSPFELFISEASLFCDTTGTVQIQIWDLKQNKMIDSFEIETTANQISYAYPSINIKFNQKDLDLLFVYDTSVIDSFNTQINQNGCSSCNLGSYYKQNMYVRARAVTIPSASAKILDNVSSNDNTSGLSLTYSINCAHEDWICGNSKLFAQPIMFKTVQNILQYGLYHTDRLNDKTLTDRDKLNQRINICQTSYTQKMSDILNSILPPSDKTCYVCNNKTKFLVHEP